MITSKCGRPMVPPGVTCIDVPKSFLYQNSLTLPATYPPYPPDTNEAKEVSGDTDFILKALSGIPAQAPALPGILYMQIMYPSGRVMQNILADISPDLGFGSGRTIFDGGGIRCKPGAKFFITLDASISGLSGSVENPTPLNTVILFEGAYRYYLKADASTRPQVRSAADSAALLPRFYHDSPNQNIMAPEWFTADRSGDQCYPECPVGFEDFPFVYSNTYGSVNGTGPAEFSEAAPQSQSIIIPIERESNFLCREILFSVQPGGTAPLFFVRLRTSLGGSSITNDYMPLQSMRVHKDWFLRRGIQVYIDVFGVSAGGDATTTLYVYLKGVKRKRVG